MWAAGRKAPGAGHSRNAAGDPALHPCSLRPGAAGAPCPGLGAGCLWVPKPFPRPRGAGSHILAPRAPMSSMAGAKGPAACVFPPPSLRAKAGSRAGAKVSHARGGLPSSAAKAKPACHPGQPKSQRMVGCEESEGGHRPKGRMQAGCRGGGLGRGMSLHL